MQRRIENYSGAEDYEDTTSEESADNTEKEPNQVRQWGKIKNFFNSKTKIESKSKGESKGKIKVRPTKPPFKTSPISPNHSSTFCSRKHMINTTSKQPKEPSVSNEKNYKMGEPVEVGSTPSQEVNHTPIYPPTVTSTYPSTVTSTYPSTVTSTYPSTVTSTYPSTVTSTYPSTVTSTYPTVIVDVQKKPDLASFEQRPNETIEQTAKRLSEEQINPFSTSDTDPDLNLVQSAPVSVDPNPGSADAPNPFNLDPSPLSPQNNAQTIAFIMNPKLFSPAQQKSQSKTSGKSSRLPENKVRKNPT